MNEIDLLREILFSMEKYKRLLNGFLINDKNVSKVRVCQVWKELRLNIQEFNSTISPRRK